MEPTMDMTHIPESIQYAIFVLVAISVILTIVFYVRDRKIKGIRKDVYKLFKIAEKKFKEPGAGDQKMDFVVRVARSYLPEWAQMLTSDKTLRKFAQTCFNIWILIVEDILDDGKINGSHKVDS